MIHNKEFFVKIGEVGKVIPVWLQESNGRPVNLTGLVVQMIVTRKGFATIIMQRTMTNDTDQVVNRGKATYTFTTPDMVLLPKGDYDLEFTATDTSNNVRKFPIDQDEPFGILHVIKSK